MAKPMENRILKLKATLLENFPGKAFDEGVNVAYFEGSYIATRFGGYVTDSGSLQEDLP